MLSYKEATRRIDEVFKHDNFETVVSLCEKLANITFELNILKEKNHINRLKEEGFITEQEAEQSDYIKEALKATDRMFMSIFDNTIFKGEEIEDYVEYDFMFGEETYRKDGLNALVDYMEVKYLRQYEEEEIEEEEEEEE